MASFASVRHHWWRTHGARMAHAWRTQAAWAKKSSSYAKILGETNFQPREFPRSGSKAKDGGRKRLNDGNKNGQLRIANATLGGARKAAWAKIIMLLYYFESEKGFMLRKIPNR